jgi:hypothetical protein
MPEVTVTPENVADIQAKVEADREANKPQDAFSARPENPDAEAPEADAPAEESAPSEEAEAPEAEASEEDESAAEAAESLGLDYQAYYTEYSETGDLSEESRAPIVEKLEAAGLPKELLDEYLDGVRARLAEGRQRAYDVVGGEESYTEMIAWARDNLSQDEADAFDAAVQNPQTATLAIKGLHADFRAAGGTPQRSMRAQGGTTQQGLAPIRSRAELASIVGSDKYKNDPAYREDVHRRLEHSRNSGQYRII